jgi:hypothetical protein
MKALLRVAFFAMCPVLGMAQMAGTWEGSLKFPARPLRIVLHISGEDNDLKAAGDSPDQGNWGGKVDSIAFSGRSLSFSIPPLDVRFKGDLMSDGTIVGTFMQHGTGLPLILARSPGVPRQPPDASSSVANGRYHNDWTGIEFTIPAKFTYIETESRSNPTGLQVDLGAADSGSAANPLEAQRKGPPRSIAAVWINKRRLRPDNIPASLTGQIPANVQRRGGTAAGYTIPENGIQKLQIGGQQAIRATAYFGGNGIKMVELLAWISTEHSIAHFYSLMPAAEMDILQPVFDQMVMSAQVP